MARTPTRWRLLDTGLRPAAENIALNQALLAARQQDISPSTLRFLGFTPSVLVGFHQSVAQEINLDYCRANGITIQRRITGGGALYCDDTQLGWELYCQKRELGTVDMSAIAKRICEAVAGGISKLGVEARFRPRNDIEVDGRKIGGTGGAFDGDAMMYQGTLLIEFDVERMLRALNIPAEKLSGKALASARERVANLADLLGAAPPAEQVKAVIRDALAQAFGVTFEQGDLSVAEQELYRQALVEIDHPDWIDMLVQPASDRPTLTAQRKFSGGMLRVNLAYDQVQKRIKQVWFSGDVFISPRRTLIDLEAALRDSNVARMAQIVDAFFAQRAVDMLTLTAADIAALMDEALATADAST